MRVPALVTMTNTPRENRRAANQTREVSGEQTAQRSGQFGIINDAIQAVGGPAAAAMVAKGAKDVIVAKINANKDVKVARIENGRPEHGGGRHRADD
jgi:hypothetical protein